MYRAYETRWLVFALRKSPTCKYGITHKTQSTLVVCLVTRKQKS